MEKQELLEEIARRKTTLDLGVYDKRTGDRHSQLGTVGEALRDAALKAERESVIEQDLDEWFATHDTDYWKLAEDALRDA